MVLHGDGSPTRRYLYAGDAADAFDTILHKGEIGQTYNVGSVDEISNMELCRRLLQVIRGIDINDEAEQQEWIKYTHDRPFNDHRYAVNAAKLKSLGWVQNTSFEEGLKTTVNWYKKYGDKWWGNIEHVLSPFPTVIANGEVKADGDVVSNGAS